MFLMFTIFGRARNHDNEFSKLRKTSFSGIVHWLEEIFREALMVQVRAGNNHLISKISDLKQTSDRISIRWNGIFGAPARGLDGKDELLINMRLTQV